MKIRKKFKSSIKRGTGEAYLIMKKNPDLNFSSEIIQASLKNYAYDSQSEGSRADYIFKFIKHSKKQAKIRRVILNRLLNEREDSWALDQLFDLAALYVEQGNEKARKAIYKRYYKKVIWGSDWLGERAILKIDGMDGLKYIARTKGKMIAKGMEDWADRFLIDDFQEEHPELNVLKILKKLAKSDQYIRAYLNTILKPSKRPPRQKRPLYNYEVVKEKIKNNAIVPLPSSYAKELSKKDVKRLADDFRKETSRLKQEKYMCVFDKIKYPYDYQDLLRLAKKSYRKKDRLIELAVGALRFFKGKDIRRFALKQLKTRSPKAFYTGLLIANYKMGDGKLLEKIIVNTRSQHKAHALVFQYVDIYKKNPTSDCKYPLIALYDKLTCGIHRAEIVEILLENQVLPKSIRKELKYDSYEDVRALGK